MNYVGGKDGKGVLFFLGVMESGIFFVGRMDLFGLVGLVGLLVGRHVVGMT